MGSGPSSAGDPCGSRPRPGYHQSQIFSEGHNNDKSPRQLFGGSADPLCSARVFLGLTHSGSRQDISGATQQSSHLRAPELVR